MTLRSLGALVVVMTACVACPGASEPDDGALIASPGDARRTEGTALPIFEHERSGHVPIDAIPGRWIRAHNDVDLELGVVDEMLVDGRRVGTYRAEMEQNLFIVEVKSCRTRMRWSFSKGDLVLTGGGPRCLLDGRWTRR